MLEDWEYEEHLRRRGPFIHEPVRPARKGHTGEQVYLQTWQKLMGEDDENGLSGEALACILSPLPRYIEQRDATVAASFMCWLGTNCGQSFMHNARNLLTKIGLLWEGNAFIMAFARENYRHRAVNDGYTMAEYLLAPETFYRGGTLRRHPEVSADDLEALSHLAAWLGSKEGQAFIKQAEDGIKNRLREEEARRLRELEKA
jgi:hypothetical protein